MIFDIDVVVTIRDREPERITNVFGSIKSFENSELRVTYILVDYGSMAALSEVYRSICEVEGYRYLYLSTVGLPWNRAHAINAGVRFGSSKYVFITDVDMIFEADLFSSIKELGPNEIYLLKPYWLQQNGIKSLARKGDKAQMGGYQLITRELFESIKGYNEKMEFWGLEDLNFVSRITRSGGKVTWLNEDEIKMYHVWHKRFNIDAFYPSSSFYLNLFAYVRDMNPGKFELYDDSWGSLSLNETRFFNNNFNTSTFKTIHYTKTSIENVCELISARVQFTLDFSQPKGKYRSRYRFLLWFKGLIQGLYGRIGLELKEIDRSGFSDHVYVILYHNFFLRKIDYFMERDRIHVYPY